MLHGYHHLTSCPFYRYATIHETKYVVTFVDRKCCHELPCLSSFTPEQQVDKMRRTIIDSQAPSEQVQAVCGQQNNSDKNNIQEKRDENTACRRARRQNLTLKEREEINARRRARYRNLTLEQREEINARRRARYQNLTLEERQGINARRRARNQNLTTDQRKEITARRRARTDNERQLRNARERAHRKSLPPEERQALLDQRNAIYAAKRDAPCTESIALQCSTGSSVGHLSMGSYAVNYPSTMAQACTTAPGNPENIHEVRADSTQYEELMSVQCPTPFLVDNSSSAPPASINNPLSGLDNICSDSSIETVRGDADNDMSEEQDDEYFIFVGRGNHEGCDGEVDSIVTENYTPDPYKFQDEGFEAQKSICTTHPNA